MFGLYATCFLKLSRYKSVLDVEVSVSRNAGSDEIWVLICVEITRTAKKTRSCMRSCSALASLSYLLSEIPCCDEPRLSVLGNCVIEVLSYAADYALYYIVWFVDWKLGQRCTFTLPDRVIILRLMWHMSTDSQKNPSVFHPAYRTFLLFWMVSPHKCSDRWLCWRYYCFIYDARKCCYFCGTVHKDLLFLMTWKSLHYVTALVKRTQRPQWKQLFSKHLVFIASMFKNTCNLNAK